MKSREAIIQVVLPPCADDALSESMRVLTRALHRAGGGAWGGFLGGEDGYGCNYANDVFAMHRFCWCESDDCPWCGGCQVHRPDPTHNEDCYQWCVHRDLLAAGFIQSPTWPLYATAPQMWAYDRARDVENEIRLKWCQHFGLPYPSGCAVHCTCGAQDAWEAELRACKCPACLPAGPWLDAGVEAGEHNDKGAPHFWHKPTGFKVWWYKYIGRSMETNKEPPDLAAMLVECLASIPDRIEEA